MVNLKSKMNAYYTMTGSWYWKIQALPLKPTRLDCSKSDGVKVITPIRPIACLNQSLDLGETSFRMM